MAEKWFAGASDDVKEDFGKDAFYVKPKAQGRSSSLLIHAGYIILRIIPGLPMLKSSSALTICP